MGDLTLSKLQKEYYREIKARFEKDDPIDLSDRDDIRFKEVLLLLETLGYIRPVGADGANLYWKEGEFDDFEAWHKDQEREERKLSAREWKIGIIGALIGLIPFFVTTVYPWLINIIK